MMLNVVQAAGSSLSSTVESIIVAAVMVVATVLAALVMDKLGKSAFVPTRIFDPDLLANSHFEKTGYSKSLDWDLHTPIA